MDGLGPGRQHAIQDSQWMDRLSYDLSIRADKFVSSFELGIEEPSRRLRSAL
jgi:hypothetical protein